MNKIYKEIAVFIVFVTFVVLLGLSINTPVNTKVPMNEPKVCSLEIKFKDRISESEVKGILQNYKMPKNYSIEYMERSKDNNSYIMVGKDKIADVRNGLEKDKNLTGYSFDAKKGDYYIITLSDQIINNENFLAILNKYSLQLKHFIWYRIYFEDNESRNVMTKNLDKIYHELMKNENILEVGISYYNDQ